MHLDCKLFLYILRSSFLCQMRTHLREYFMYGLVELGRCINLVSGYSISGQRAGSIS